MKIKYLAKFIIISGIVGVAAITVAAQGDEQTRSITSDDFAKNRPAATKSNGKTPVPHRRTYNFVRVDKNVVRPKSAPVKTTVPPKTATKVTDIGLTMWRLRPTMDSEKGFLLLPVLLDDKRTKQMWLAERVDTDAAFKADDRVRFAIESSSKGYLYVIDRETLSNGSFGQPILIFPAKESDDNTVRPGLLFDFPDRNDEWPYLKIQPKKANYTGELMTIIVSSKPLTGITTDGKGHIRNGAWLADLESEANVEIFSRADMADKIYSKPESEGSCGIKTRELRPETTADTPCGIQTRELTRDEPLPQSIYRVKGRAGQPAVAFVKLNVKSK